VSFISSIPAFPLDIEDIIIFGSSVNSNSEKDLRIIKLGLTNIR